jgi:hypothetical protein
VVDKAVEIENSISENTPPSELVEKIDSISNEICLLGDCAEYCKSVHGDLAMVGSYSL